MDAVDFDIPIHLWWLQPGRLAGSSFPRPHQITFIKIYGFTAIVTLTEELPASPQALTRIFGEGNWLHLPVEDYAAPTQDQFDTLLEFLEAHASGTVLVHCRAGYGRTGTALAAALIGENPGISAAGAIATIRFIKPGAIETRQQEEALEILANRIRDKHGHTEGAGKHMEGT